MSRVPRAPEPGLPAGVPREWAEPAPTRTQGGGGGGGGEVELCGESDGEGEGDGDGEEEEAEERVPVRGKKRVRWEDEQVERTRKKRDAVLERELARTFGPLRERRKAEADAALAEHVGQAVRLEDGTDYYEGPLPELKNKRDGGEVEHTTVDAPQLPQPPFTWNIVGPSGQGKTTRVAALLAGPYRGRFDKVFFFVPSFYTDDQWRHIAHDPARVFARWDPEDFGEILRFQKKLCYDERQRGSRAPDVLIVIDDSMGFQVQFIRISRTRSRAPIQR